jgi:hypothetical protein
MTEFKECRHIMPNGLHCKSPAMRGSVFCYFHGRTPRPTRPPRTLESNIEIPPVIGPGEVVGAVHQIIQALAANRISTRRASILLQGVQIASGHLLSGLIRHDAPPCKTFAPISQSHPPRAVE